MVEVCTQVRKWGSSVGVVIPKDAAKKAGVKEGDTVCLLIRGKKNPMEETFGMLKGKLKRPTDEILKETDREGWDE